MNNISVGDMGKKMVAGEIYEAVQQTVYFIINLFAQKVVSMCGKHNKQESSCVQ